MLLTSVPPALPKHVINAYITRLPRCSRRSLLTDNSAISQKRPRWPALPDSEVPNLYIFSKMISLPTQTPAPPTRLRLLP